MSNSHSKKETWLGIEVEKDKDFYCQNLHIYCSPWFLDDFGCLEKKLA